MPYVNPNALAEMRALAEAPTLGNMHPDARKQAIARATLADFEATTKRLAADEEFFRAMLWPYGHGEHSTFRAFKPEPRDPHGPWFVVMPGGDALSLNHCSDDAVDEARCRWMVDALNAALASSAGNAGVKEKRNG